MYSTTFKRLKLCLPFTGFERALLTERSTQLGLRLEERSTQQEQRLGQLEGELVRKDELFEQTKTELTNNVTNAYAVGFDDATTQVAYAHPEVDLFQTGLSKMIVDGQLVNAQE